MFSSFKNQKLQWYALYKSFSVVWYIYFRKCIIRMHYHFYTFFFMVLSFKNNKTFKLYTPKKYLKWLLTFLCFFFNTTMVFSLKNQKIQRSRRTTFKFTIKNISKFILWKIIFFSIIPFTTASVVDVDKDYKSYQDVYNEIYLNFMKFKILK